MTDNSSSIVDNDKYSISSRYLDINISGNGIEAYVTVTYSSHKENMTENDDKAKNKVPLYTLKELRDALDKAGIVYGIIEENLEKCLNENGVSNILIARGEEPIDGTDDILDIKFDIDKDIRKLNEDKRGRIDFKSIGAVSEVSKGDILAVIIPGNSGSDGRDIKGKSIRCMEGRQIKLRNSQGCEIVNENTVVATISGKPCIKNNAFYVYTVHEVPGDVNIKTGNIMFLGDIVVLGSVREGMKVISGNSVTVHQNVLDAEIKSRGDITLKGNVISSNINAGGEDTEKLKEIEVIDSFVKCMNDMITAIEEIKKFNLLGYDVSDGQIIKILSENKFKSTAKLCMNIIAHIIKSRQNDNSQGEKLLTLVKDKLIGLAPLNIKHYSELFELVNAANERLEYLRSSLAIPVNVKLNYCQDSTVSSSGDIVISGRGSYVSTIYAQGNVYFTEEMSIVRGGSIKADAEIRCRTVGSLGGVTTKLMTGEKGHIYAVTAYENTIFSVGGREIILDYASKNVHAYLDNNYELVVDKLRV